MVYEWDGKERLLTGHTGRVFLLTTLIWVCMTLPTRLLPPLLPEIIDELAITSFLAGIALTVERIVRSGIEFPSGRFADQFSRTSVLVVSIGCVILSVMLLSISFTYVAFLLAVAVYGLGRGMFTPAALAMISDIFHSKRGRAFGLHKAGSEIAGILGAGIAIVTVAIATWRSAFLPLALLLIPLLLLFYKLSREPIRIGRVDLKVQKTGFRILKDPSLRLILIVYSMFNFASHGVSTFLPTFLIDVHSVSVTFASAAFALLYVVGIFAKSVSGYLSDIIYPRSYVAAGGLFIGAAGLAILLTAPNEVVAIGGVIVFAIGYRGISPGLQAFLMDRIPDKSKGGDFGALRTIWQTLGSFGPAYTGFVVTTTGFIPTFFSFMIFYLFGAVILLWFSVNGWPARSNQA